MFDHDQSFRAELLNNFSISQMTENVLAARVSILPSSFFSINDTKLNIFGFITIFYRLNLGIVLLYKKIKIKKKSEITVPFRFT